MTEPPTPYGVKVTDSCLHCVSRTSGVFSGIEPETLARLNAIRQVSVYPPNAVLFVEGEKPRGLFVLCTGRARLSITSRTGKRITLREVEPCEAIGLSSVVADCPHGTSAETVAPSQVGFFPRTELLRHLHNSPDASFRVSVLLSAELQRAWEQTRLLALAPCARAKLAALLLSKAALHGKHTTTGVRVALNLTAEQIGEEIGVNRETVSRLLADLKRARLLQVNGGSVLLKDPDELRALAER